MPSKKVSLFDLKFPLYKFNSYGELIKEGSILLFCTNSGTKYFVDNKLIVGDSLGLRRMRYIGEYKLYPFKTVVYSISDIINSKLPKWFIDSSGTIYKVPRKGRKSWKVQYYRVTDTKVGGQSNIICYLEDINKMIEIPYIPYDMPKYLGLIHTGVDYILYELSMENKPIKTIMI